MPPTPPTPPTPPIIPPPVPPPNPPTPPSLGSKLKTGALTAADAANQVRIGSILSGWALPKSLLGNVGAPMVATADNLDGRKGES